VVRERPLLETLQAAMGRKQKSATGHKRSSKSRYRRAPEPDGLGSAVMPSLGL